MDFVMDGLATGRALRLLTMVDNYTRECLAIEVDSCLSSQRVTRVRQWVMEQRGAPEAIRCDNGPRLAGAFSGVVRRAPHRTGSHPAGPPDAERTRGEF